MPYNPLNHLITKVTKMKNSIINELIEHVEALIADGVLTSDNKDDWHHLAFNEDYYIIGHYNAEKWLEKHNVSAWKAIDYVTDMAFDQFGEGNVAINPENIVNTLVYFAGYDALQEIEEDA